MSLLPDRKREKMAPNVATDGSHTCNDLHLCMAEGSNITSNLSRTSQNSKLALCKKKTRCRGN